MFSINVGNEFTNFKNWSTLNPINCESYGVGLSIKLGLPYRPGKPFLTWGSGISKIKSGTPYVPILRKN